MKIFTAIQTQWREFIDASTKYLSDKLGKDGSYGPSNIFGHILTVLNGAIQNIMLYIEDSLTEQNIRTAQRKKSIYSLAKLSGYEPSFGTASKCSIKLTHNSTSGIESEIVVIPNRTTIISTQNGLTYNIILPQDSIKFDIHSNNQVKYVSAVEGTFITQEFTSEGGELYTQNIALAGDIDIDYVTVIVNGEEWSRVDSLYDMNPDGKQYCISAALSKGFDIIFGNGQYGRILEDGDVISVEYLNHNGESGNINADEDITFTFLSSLENSAGESIDGNNIFTVELDSREGITSGTFSESIESVRKMVGYNSRSLVLADPRNYKIFFNRFSFIGYNRCWSEPGSLVVNALVLKNYKQLCSKGSDYFNLLPEDFKIGAQQKESIVEAITRSGQQISGTILNFIDPEIKRYAMFIYLKMKSGIVYDEEIIKNNVRNLIGNFFGDLQSDIYIPKSDIDHLLKSNIPQIDGINIYIISEDNEKAKISGHYTEKKFIYTPSSMTYHVIEREVVIKDGEDPHLGLDDHGNILLENDMYYPILSGSWNYDNGTDNGVTLSDPLQIIFQN